MSEYVLKINKGNKNINKLIKTEGYTFNPKNDIVKSFTVYDEKFLNKIILNKFTKEYKKVKAINNLSFEVHEGEILGLLRTKWKWKINNN